MFAETTSVLRVGAGRQIEVVLQLEWFFVMRKQQATTANATPGARQRPLAEGVCKPMNDAHSAVNRYHASILPVPLN